MSYFGYSPDYGCSSSFGSGSSSSSGFGSGSSFGSGSGSGSGSELNPYGRVYANGCLPYGGGIGPSGYHVTVYSPI